MTSKVLPGVVLCGIVILAGCATQKTVEKKGPIRQYVETDTGRWLIHDVNRPRPPVVTPGKVPSDAVLLFGGSDPNLSGWTDMEGGDSKWIVRDDYMESVKGAGYIRTKREFGSCQLHVEFRTPVPVKGSVGGVPAPVTLTVTRLDSLSVSLSSTIWSQESAFIQTG